MSRYTDSVDHYLEGVEHISTGALGSCDECSPEGFDDDDDEARELYGEPGFSSIQCDACGSTFAGDRHPAHGILNAPDLKIHGMLVHLDVCVDCLFYLANGDEPEEEDWHRTPSEAQGAWLNRHGELSNPYLLSDPR